MEDVKKGWRIMVNVRNLGSRCLSSIGKEIRDMTDVETLDLKVLTAEIVGAHIANNSVSASDVPGLIKAVHDALAGLGQEPVAQPEQAQKPAVSIKQSVKPDYIVCLEDGARMKTLKRYLQTKYNMTPAEYRNKWGLPADYPMTAPNYSEHRRALAKAIGLGNKVLAKVVEVAPKAEKAASRKPANKQAPVAKKAAPARRKPKAS
jgi:predicted transcriptional regulator